MNTLIRKKLHHKGVTDFSRAKVYECLEALGLIERKADGRMTAPERYRRISRFEGFWGQDRYDLEDTLREAKERFHQVIMDVHPDKSLDHDEDARVVIAAYRQLTKLFKRHRIT